MAKQITREINAVEMKGINVGSAFITKLNSGEYAAYNEAGEQVASAEKRQELIDKFTTEAPEVRSMQIYILPPQRTLPRGHVLQAAFRNGQIIASKATEVTDGQQIHEICTDAVNKAGKLGFKWSLPKIMSMGINYRTTVTQFKRDPRLAIEYLTRSQQREDTMTHDEGLPF